jgi:hypothetical protein
MWPVVGVSELWGFRTEEEKMLVLNNIPYQFQKSLSDIAGQDVTTHNNESTEVITIVRRFLYSHSIESRKKAIPHSMIMIHRYELFQAHLTSIYEELGVSSNLDDLEDLMEYTKVAVKWIKEYQWFPSS